MNRRRLLSIGALALILGSVSSYLVYKRLLSRVVPARVDVSVIIAANDIQVGAKLTDQDLKVVKYPPEDLPTHVFRTKTSIIGRAAVVPIAKGEFVISESLAGEDAGAGLSAVIAKGMRAVAVRVNDVTAVGGFAVPGTRVDVLVTGNASGSGEPATITLLQNVAVVASGRKIEHSATGEPLNAAVVTLLVSPEDAERVTLASREGQIQLVLRRLGDADMAKPPAIKRTTLFGNGQAMKPAMLIRPEHMPSLVPEPTKIEIDVFRGSQKETVHIKQ
jgi:pilus assembly protein CpaB